MAEQGGLIFAPVYQHILTHGPLARRLVRRYGTQPNHEQLVAMVDALSDCLSTDALFV